MSKTYSIDITLRSPLVCFLAVFGAIELGLVTADIIRTVLA